MATMTKPQKLTNRKQPRAFFECLTEPGSRYTADELAVKCRKNILHVRSKINAADKKTDRVFEIRGMAFRRTENAE